MSIGDFHESPPGSDDELLREQEEGDGVPTGDAASEGSSTIPTHPPKT